MGIDRFSGITKTNKKLVDFNKKRASGKDDNADQTKILSLSTKISEARAKIENSKQASLSLNTESFSVTNNKEASEKKKYEGPKLKAPVFTTELSKYQEELQIAQESLSQAKINISTRMDNAILSDSGEDINSLRQNYKELTEASELNQEASDIAKDPSLKDPELIKKIHAKTAEITNLSLDKTKPGRAELLASAKQELTLLKGQLFSM
tara:strand:- start:557 stop:1183 length:627 start_codon:yes stop_codon:yes gene_type:complete